MGFALTDGHLRFAIRVPQDGLAFERRNHEEVELLTILVCGIPVA